MNTKQRRVILLGFAVILLMGLFPPWESAADVRGFRGYGFLFPGFLFSGHVWWSNTVACPLLLVQWFLVSCVTGIVVMFLGECPEREEKRRKKKKKPTAIQLAQHFENPFPEVSDEERESGNTD